TDKVLSFHLDSFFLSLAIDSSRSLTKDILPCWSAAVSRGEGTGRRAGRGGGRTRGHFGDQGEGRIDGQGGQVGGHGSEVNDGDQGRSQGNNKNQNGDAVNDNTQGDVRNAIENNDRRVCTYKEFLACNPKEYDGKGGVVVYTRWIKKAESVRGRSIKC
nr:reverse transcriptase domain-containing protein [Tanacetum cinerariifolium]